MFWFKKHQNRKWDERPVLYKSRFAVLKKIAQGALVILMLGAIAALTVYLRTADALALKNVEVHGELRHVTRDEVIRLAGINSRDQLFSLDLGAVQQGILRHHWIDLVRLRREFPSTLQIHVTERVPVALLSVDDRYLIDRDGVVFKKSGPDDAGNLPVITGFSRKKLVKYPRRTRAELNATLAVLEFLQGQGFYREEGVSEINHDSVAGFTVYTAGRGREIYYGRGDFAHKQQSLEKFKLSKYFSEGGFVRLDLDSPGKVIARRL